MGINKHRYQPQVFLKCGIDANDIKWAIKEKVGILGLYWAKRNNPHLFVFKYKHMGINGNRSQPALLKFENGANGLKGKRGKREKRYNCYF